MGGDGWKVFKLIQLALFSFRRQKKLNEKRNLKIVFADPVWGKRGENPHPPTGEIGRYKIGYVHLLPSITFPPYDSVLALLWFRI